MSNKLKTLIELIQKNKTCNEICEILEVSNKQLYNYINILENQGYLLKRKYYADGNIVYSMLNTIDDINNLYNRFATDSTTIITEPNADVLKCLVIADLHYGNSREMLNVVEKAYDYCVKENIHTVFCCGDMVDGTYSAGEQTIKDTHEQVKYFIQNHPHRKNILTYAVGGDHDMSVLRKNFQDLRAITRSYRHDIIMPSYQTEIIKIKNDQILLYHPDPIDNETIDNKKTITRNGIKTPIDTRSFILKLEGHHHKCYSRVYSNGNVELGIPSLSGIQIGECPLPSAMQLELRFTKGYITYITANQLLFYNDELIPVNSIRFEIPLPNETSNTIQNEETKFSHNNTRVFNNAKVFNNPKIKKKKRY